MGCNLSFTRSFNACYLVLWSECIIFRRLNTIKEFVTSFQSLILNAADFLLWKKILSITLFKMITVSRPSTLVRFFLMGRSWCTTKGGLWVGVGSPPPCKLKCLKFLLLLGTSEPKNWYPTWSQTTYWKDSISNSF